MGGERRVLLIILRTFFSYSGADQVDEGALGLWLALFCSYSCGLLEDVLSSWVWVTTQLTRSFYHPILPPKFTRETKHLVRRHQLPLLPYYLNFMSTINGKCNELEFASWPL